MEELYCALIFLILALIILNRNYFETWFTHSKICNEIDKRCYKIVNKYTDQQIASEKLAHLNKFSLELLRHLRTKYIFNAVDPAMYKSIKFLLNNYNSDNIIENAPIDDKNTSYVDNKGEVFAICIREKKSGKHKFHDNKILEFVTMHEIAHLMTIEYDHSLQFWRNFKLIMQEAKIAGLHEPVNYKKEPVVYCSLKVDYSPYYDEMLN